MIYVLQGIVTLFILGSFEFYFYCILKQLVNSSIYLLSLSSFVAMLEEISSTYTNKRKYILEFQNAFKSTGPTPSSSPVSATPQAPVTPQTPAASTAGPGLTPEQQQMVLAFSQQSHMNAEWSQQ